MRQLFLNTCVYVCPIRSDGIKFPPPSRRRRRRLRLRNELQPFKQLSEKQFRCLGKNVEVKYLGEREKPRTAASSEIPNSTDRFATSSSSSSLTSRRSNAALARVRKKFLKFFDIFAVDTYKYLLYLAS